MNKRIWRTKKRKRLLPYPSPQSIRPRGWRGECLAVLGWKWHSCSSHAAPLLHSSAANCLVRGTMLEAVTLQTAPGEVRQS